VSIKLGEFQSLAEQARCYGAPLEMFFPQGNSDKQIVTNQAVIRDYCDKCPIKRQCDDYATANGLEGIWGGKLRVSHGRESLSNLRTLRS
jgi:hypothetical protein